MPNTDVQVKFMSLLLWSSNIIIVNCVIRRLSNQYRQLGQLLYTISHGGGCTRIIGLKPQFSSFSLSEDYGSTNPFRLVAISLNSSIHWLISEQISLFRLRLQAKHLLITIVLKLPHSGTNAGNRYLSRIQTYRRWMVAFTVSIRSHSCPKSPGKELIPVMILEMKCLYSYLLLSRCRARLSRLFSSPYKYCLPYSTYPPNSCPSAALYTPDTPSANTLSKYIRALGKSKSGSSGSWLCATQLARLLTNFLNSFASWRGSEKSSRIRRRWKSFFLILEFISILLDMLETRAVKLIPSRNHSWLSTRCIYANDTTFFPSKLSRVPTHASYSL